MPANIRPDRYLKKILSGPLGRRLAPAARLAALKRPGRRSRADLDTLAKRIILPTLPVTDEEMARATHQDSGQKLARQERWDDLAQRIRYADDARLTTPGGEAASALLAFGARSDVVAAAEDSLHDGMVPDPAGIEALEDMLTDMPDEYACTLVVALAHLDIAWAWHQIAGPDGTGEHRLRFRAHLGRARDLLAPHDAADLDAPSLAAARCLLTALDPDARPRLADAYETLIDLDPDCPRHMRALGVHLLSTADGDVGAIELQARRTAARTGEIWGAGGYTWVYLDALSLDPDVLTLLDDAFFIEGMADILDRKRNQHIVNLFTAFCAIAMTRQQGDGALSGSAEAARAKLHGCLDWLLSAHLQELHPLIWSQALLTPGAAMPLPSRRALVDKGRKAALRAIAERFAAEIEDGSAIAFSASGMYRLPAL
ncbi:hypothetical protein [Roseovarius sp. SYSU LYC5161]|uniref:hypothetical protein n=1 Tax=Roseovarius halophilus (ex Wu et al. 2025) TaxID=3376060 RepID=UPI00399B01BE